MSLINQMLQDLDARRAAHGVGNQLPNDVRPLPKLQARRWPILFVLFLIALLAAAAWFLLMREVAPQVLAPTPVTAPAIETPPLVIAAAPVALALDIEPSLRLTDSLPTRADAASEPVVKPVVEVLGAPQLRPTPAAAEKPVRPQAGVASRPAQAAAAKPPADVTPVAPPALATKTPPLIERTAAAGTPGERAEGEYRKAVAAANQGRNAEAVESLREALRRDGLHIPARQLLLKLLLESRESREAIKLLQDGLAGQPAQISWAMMLARLQVDQGDLAAAVQTLEFSRPAAAQNADYLGFSANVLQRLGRQAEAAGLFTQAARLAPADGRWWLGLGLALNAEGRGAEAKAAFMRARQASNLGPELQALVEQNLR